MNIIKHLIKSDKTPVYILTLSAVIGAVVGFIGVLFQLGVAFISTWRMTSVEQHFSAKWQIILATFIFSACLTMLAYYLVKRFAPEAGGSGIPDIEGALQDLRPVR